MISIVYSFFDSLSHALSHHKFIKLTEVERTELFSIPVIELILELNPEKASVEKIAAHHQLDNSPVQTERVQECRETLHDHQHRHRQPAPHRESNKNHEHVTRHQCLHKHRLIEDRGELCVREAEGPQTQVRGGVGDGSEHEFDGVDDLLDEDLRELELLLVIMDLALLRGRRDQEIRRECVLVSGGESVRA